MRRQKAEGRKGEGEKGRKGEGRREKGGVLRRRGQGVEDPFQILKGCPKGGVVYIYYSYFFCLFFASTVG
jgi:hypothetical protein